MEYVTNCFAVIGMITVYIIIAKAITGR